MEEQSTHLGRHVEKLRTLIARGNWPICMVCPIPPSLNRMQRAVNSRIVDSSEYREYKASFARQVTDKNPHLITLPDDVYVTSGIYLVYMVFYFDRILKKTKGGGPSPFMKLDVDNRVKPLLDSIKDFTGIDDANFFTSIAQKECDSEDARVEVEIWRVQ